jgi:RNA polymerase sigma-70 factor (ECF subfamily)
MNKIEQIWKDNHKKLHNFIRGRVEDASIAEDLLQDIFVRIHSRIDGLKDNDKIQSWIYRITRNTNIDYYRSHRNAGQLTASVKAPEIEPSEKARQEISSWLLPMIRELPENYRDALILSEIEGLKQKEVALKQGLSLSGAKARIQRGCRMPQTSSKGVKHKLYVLKTYRGERK